jgi:hypothetical protein
MTSSRDLLVGLCIIQLLIVVLLYLSCVDQMKLLQSKN